MWPKCGPELSCCLKWLEMVLTSLNLNSSPFLVSNISHAQVVLNPFGKSGLACSLAQESWLSDWSWALIKPLRCWTCSTVQKPTISSRTIQINVNRSMQRCIYIYMHIDMYKCIHLESQYRHRDWRFHTETRARTLSTAVIIGTLRNGCSK